MRKPKKSQQPFTGVKMDRGLYQKARERARERHQTYSEYVRQLILRDVEQSTQGATI